MTTISELYSETGPIHGVQGPIPGVLTHKRTLTRGACARRFGAGTPVRVEKPTNYLFDAGTLLIDHEGQTYVRHLCSEDGEQLDDFVTGRGKRARLTQEVAVSLGVLEANLERVLDKGQAVNVYRQAGGRMWITTEDNAWSTWFTDGSDAFEKFVTVDATDMARLDDMPEHKLVLQPGALDVGRRLEGAKKTRRLTL